MAAFRQGRMEATRRLVSLPPKLCSQSKDTVMPPSYERRFARVCASDRPRTGRRHGSPDRDSDPGERNRLVRRFNPDGAGFKASALIYRHSSDGDIATQTILPVRRPEIRQ